MYRQKLVWLLPFLLFGCDKGPNLAQMCEDNPEICAKIKEDNHCKRERNNTIIADVALKASQDDQQRYELLMAYEDYKACMGLASQIEHIKLKEKKSVRVENLEKVTQLIADLSAQTKHTSNPSLLYYHWTRNLDDNALAKFLRMEGSAALETPESQLHLATYYTKKDQNKTLALLFHALELYKAGDSINSEIFHSLTSIFADKREYKQAYIWLKVLAMYQPDDPTLNDSTIKQYVERYHLDAGFLNKVASSTLEKIKQGSFKAPKF